MNIEFEWDEPKNQSNLIKHALRFEYAVLVFLDDNGIDFEDSRYDYGARRYITTGFIENKLYTVVYTKRNHKIRVISARRAHREERKNYYFYLETRRST